MRRRLAKFLLVILAIGGAVYGYLAIATRIETERMATPLPHASSTPVPRLNHATVIDDVRNLADPAFEGRKTGTAGNKRARDWLVERFRTIGLAPIGASYLQPFTFLRKSGGGLFNLQGKSESRHEGINIIGSIAGSDASRILLISAHYDHLGIVDGKLFPGTDDNASGVATMLAIADYFKAHPPQHTMVFVAFDGEEQGLRGARHFAANLPFPRERLALNLNMDMVSHSDNNEIFASGIYHWPVLQSQVEAAAKQHAVRVLLGHDRPAWRAGSVEDWTESSDHGPLHALGVPYLYFGVEDHADYHATSDTYASLRKDFLLRAAELILEVTLLLDQNMTTLSPPASARR